MRTYGTIKIENEDLKLKCLRLYNPIINYNENKELPIVCIHDLIEVGDLKEICEPDLYVSKEELKFRDYYFKGKLIRGKLKRLLEAFEDCICKVYVKMKIDQTEKSEIIMAVYDREELKEDKIFRAYQFEMYKYTIKKQYILF